MWYSWCYTQWWIRRGHGRKRSERLRKLSKSVERFFEFFSSKKWKKYSRDLVAQPLATYLSLDRSGEAWLWMVSWKGRSQEVGMKINGKEHYGLEHRSHFVVKMYLFKKFCLYFSCIFWWYVNKDPEKNMDGHSNGITLN